MSQTPKTGNTAKTEPVRVGTAHCPVCGQPVQARFRPFCSKRCADVDLHRWLGGIYRVPTEEPADPADLLAAREGDEESGGNDS